MSIELSYKFIRAKPPIADFVYSFSSIKNLASLKEGVIIPNGKIDLIFTITPNNQLSVLLIGLETKPKPMPQQVAKSFFSVSFNPLAIEYIFKQSVSTLLNKGKIMPDNFWDISINDLQDFDLFCEKITEKIVKLMPSELDKRKLKLFQLIFESHGDISIKQLSETIFWNERQLNRYFNQQFGISLKTYCNILRFQASLPQIKEGNLYPDLNFTDQSHFIKEIKKLSGVTPKELYKNKNDRFLQFLVYSKK